MSNPIWIILQATKVNRIRKSILFSDSFREILRKSEIGYEAERFAALAFASGIIVAVIFSAFSVFLWIIRKFPLYIIIIIFLGSFIFTFYLVTLIPYFALQNRKAMIESDLLYSARHLLLKLESGSSLLNSLDSVSKLNTKSSLSFREIVYDVSLGMPIENAIEKAIDKSPSKAYTKILEKIDSSMKTGADIHKTLKSTLRDITKMHLIQIQEYGKKLNPMSMFYMIIGTILPSLGTAMIVVGASLLPGALIIDKRILLSIAFLVFVIQIFFVLAFKSLKPGVME